MGWRGNADVPSSSRASGREPEEELSTWYWNVLRRRAVVCSMIVSVADTVLVVKSVP